MTKGTTTPETTAYSLCPCLTIITPPCVGAEYSGTGPHH